VEPKGQEKRASLQRTAFRNGEHANCAARGLHVNGEKKGNGSWRAFVGVTFLPAPGEELMHV